MRSSLFSLPMSAQFDAQGYLLDAQGRVVPGFVRVATLPADTQGPDRVLVHSAPGRAIPGQAIAVGVDGRQGAWTIAQLKAAKPQEARQILEAVYEVMENGQVERRRSRLKDVPVGATVLATDLPPHVWAGDEV